MKTIGILTSGGDAPGMNAAIRAVTRTAIFNGIRIMGIRFGYDGLINGNIYEMNVSSVADIIQRGGTILGSARSSEFITERGQKKAYNILQDFGIDGLVVLGGDGSYRGAEVLSNMGIKTIGIPCTIDNDMGYTDSTIGFYTAIDTVSEAISKLRDTSSSHGRANIVEVMGRHCGDIALYSGVASGAESIIIPERELDMEAITSKIKRGRKRGKLHHIIVLAEGVGKPYELKEDIKRITGVDTKVTILGHVQRGGSPCPYDRLLASEMGNKAVQLLIEGQSGLALATINGKIVPVPIKEAVETKRELNQELYDMAGEISI
ncbi:6-phosphofructokinase [Miniphocaeibacter halophilus]|uniref:6-phosphofructokinase n=1 Tax=Miniphocaeibacter halophilus TaxID=2931922 RepID=A0AC61MQM1_9FIRM|nr:6-phosphofructokinase [Miniphocaeibacter halophilus]QQK07947.1 6-phosphofructokinase [Miniphocaeibacter halophilus]